MINKKLHRKVIMEQHEARKQPRVNSGTPEGYTVPALQVSPVALLLLMSNQLYLIISWNKTFEIKAITSSTFIKLLKYKLEIQR